METEDGYKITIRRSKTDQEGHGVTIAIARGVTTCPVKCATSGINPWSLGVRRTLHKFEL